jgi:hypothetical protein
MTVWQVQPLSERYLRGGQAVRALDPSGRKRASAEAERTVALPADQNLPADQSLRVDQSLRAGHRLTADQISDAEDGPTALTAGGHGPTRALALLLGGYMVTAAVVAWALAKGHPSTAAIQALAPISVVVAVLVGIAALGVAIFARRYMVHALATLGLCVGVAVAAGGALVTAIF